MKYSFAVACLIANTSAIQLQDPSLVHGTWYGDEKAPKVLNFNDQEVHPLETHENEDYHSGPDPLSGIKYLTSTQVKYIRSGQTDLSTEEKPHNPAFFRAYNAGSPAPSGPGRFYSYVGIEVKDSDESSEESEEEVDVSEQESESESESQESEESESESESEQEDNTTVLWRQQLSERPEETVVTQMTSQGMIEWHVAPDLGEHDPGVVGREKDTANGKKESGWTNPLGWADNGNDDDQVLAHILLQQRYDESEGPTKADNGELDQIVVMREHDTKNGEKASGWTNPLGWTDGGDADETVL